MEFYNVDTPEGMAAALAWTMQFLTFLHDGSVWVVPRSRSSYRINKTDHKVTRLCGMGDSAVEKVFRELGFEVLEASGCPADRETQHGRYVDCGPLDWDE